MLYRPALALCISLVLPALVHRVRAEDWGAYSIAPVSAPALVLEAASSGASEGTVVSIGTPSGAASQKWTITAKGEGAFILRPLHATGLVMAAAKSEGKNGTLIVLERETGAPSQLWTVTKLENGNYVLAPKHAPGMGLDDFGGGNKPGSRIDLWIHKPGDQHLEWKIAALAGSGAAAPAPNAASSYSAPEIAPEQIRRGEIKTFKFEQSKVFPGTTRDVTVFIPAQYDGAKPACVYVKTDGFNPREQELLETMIATKEIPVTIGVFVRPGTLPAPMKGAGDRRNRCFEYDGVNDNNVRFLDEELLPFIAKEYGLKLSTDGNDRAIAGGSSGGIAAFTAAWHRPESFSRVYAASGSWVAFRGGHEFPTMVRKFEAKPIRAFLTTATHDMENAAGDWFLLDQEMDKALAFSGYDYQFRVVEGRHVQGYIEHWREAMAFLWKGWPERVKAGPSAPRAQEIIIPGEGWQLVAEGFKSTRGPATAANGEVFFADTSANKIHKIGLDGKVAEFVADAGAAHGLAIGADGKVYTVSEKTGKVMSYEANGLASVVLDGLTGQSIVAVPNGGFYVTSNSEKSNAAGSVWFVKDGRKTQIDAGLKFATGIAYRPDRWLLSVADGRSKWVFSYQIQDDGSLTNKERFFPLHVADWDDDAGAETVCYSIEGRQFIATKCGVQISADDGPTQVILPVPDRARVIGVALGGPEKDTLFALCGTKIWKRKVQQHAMGAWAPWTPVKPTKL